MKAICWGLAALTVFLLLGWPFLVGLPAKNATKAVLRAYAVRSEIWFAGLMAAFLGTTVAAALVVKQSREEYLQDSSENLRKLIEGTLEDHRKKSGSTDGN